MITRMRKNGQFTIPAEIRKELHLSKGSILSMVKLGNGIFIVPRSSAEILWKPLKKTAGILKSKTDSLKTVRKLRNEWD